MRMPRFNPLFKGFHVVFPLPKLFGAVAMTIFPFVFYNNKNIRANKLTYAHEVIHIHQQMEVGLVGLFLYIIVNLVISSCIWFWTLPVLFLFEWLYWLFWIINKIQGFDNWRAYKLICFELEANYNCNIYKYYVIRRPFAWIRYIKNKI